MGVVEGEWRGLTLPEDGGFGEELPRCKVGGLGCAIGASGVEGFLHVHVDCETHREPLDFHLIISDIELQLT